MSNARVLRVALVGFAIICPTVSAAELVIYGFECNPEGWNIPPWEQASSDYVAKSVAVSQAQKREGACSLELQMSFPGERWAGAYVERETEVTDWTPFGTLSVDVYLPSHAPQGLGARIILSVGEKWVWTEMNRAVPLVPGEWTTVTVNLKPDSMDWKFFLDDNFRKAVRRIGVRVEVDHGLPYTGSVFLDNVRVEE